MFCLFRTSVIVWGFLGLQGPGLASAQSLPTPVICEDTIDGHAPFDSNNVPCLLGCGSHVAQATGSLLPGSVNLTEIPYCQLDCVHRSATPEESSAAPSCYEACKAHNQATPENIGWCMYWCVDGFQNVPSTSCVPSLEYGAPITTVVGRETVTFALFTEPAAWQSWYSTQTVLAKTGIVAVTSSVAPKTTTTGKTTQSTIRSTGAVTDSTATNVFSAPFGASPSSVEDTEPVTTSGSVLTTAEAQTAPADGQSIALSASTTTSGGHRLRVPLFGAALAAWSGLALALRSKY